MALMSLGLEEAEPEVTYADASLNIVLNDADGNELASTALTANGIVGESAVFMTADIEAAVSGLVPEGYELNDAEYNDVEVAYGESESTEFSASVTEEEPAEDEDNSFLSKLGNAIKSVVDTVTGFFKSLFKW